MTASNAAMLRTILEQRAIRGARQTVAALDWQGDEFDLVMLTADARMDGSDAIAAIRARPARPVRPIVAVIGGTPDEARLSWTPAPMRSLPKPVHVSRRGPGRRPKRSPATPETRGRRGLRASNRAIPAP